MKRRIFIRSGSAAAMSAALIACGGGGGTDSAALEAEVLSRSTAPGQLRKKPGAPDPAPTTPTAPTPEPTPPAQEPTVTGPTYADGTARLNALLNGSLNVAIPAGTYVITGELNVRDGHVIAAAPDAQVILKAGDGYAGHIIRAIDKRITVRGITFDGNYASRLSLEGNEGASLISLTGASGSVFENNKFQYAPSFAIWNYRSTQLQIRGNTFLETYHAIRIDGADLDNSGTIENNTFKNTAAFKSIQHVEAVYTRGLVVRANTMEGAGLAEPSSHGYEGTWGNSIYIFNSTGYLVEGNRVGKNYWSSLVSGMNGTNAVIRNNTFTDGPLTPIAAWIEQEGAAYITFDGNQLDGGLFVGDNGGDHLTITNNVIRSRSVGVDVSFAAKDVLLQNNKFFSKAGYRNENGAYLWEKKDPATNVRLIGNHFEGFNNGIAINNMGGTGTVYGITLSGNTFANNNQNIWVPGGITLSRPLGQ